MVPTVLDALGVEPPADDPRRERRRRSRASASRTPSTRRTRATRHHTQYFEMFGHRAIYHDGWRAVCPWPGPSFTEAAAKLGRKFGDPITPGGARRARPQRLGALPHRRGPDRVAERGRASTRTGCASWSRAGGWRPASTRCCRSTARCRQRLATVRPQTVQAAHALRLLPGRLGRAGLRGAAGLQPPVLDRGRRRDPRRRRRGRAAGPGRRRRRLLASTSRTGGCASSTTTSASTTSRCARTDAAAGRPAPPALRVRAHRRARHRATARASRAAASSTSTARSSAATDFPHTTPLFFELEGSAAATTSAPPPPSTRRRSRSRARSASSRSTSRVS